MSPDFEEVAQKALQATLGKSHANNPLFVGGTPQNRAALVHGLVEKMNLAGANPPTILEISGDKASLEDFLASPPGTKGYISKDLEDVMADPEARDLLKLALQRGGLMGHTTMGANLFRQDKAISRRMSVIDLSPK